MKNKLIILKIGGSVITEKKKNVKKLKKKTLERLAQEITNSKRKEKFSLIIIHGVGAFGHITAKKFKLDKGFKDRSQIKAIAELHTDLKKLNLEIIKIFKEKGLNVVPFTPSSAWTLNNKRLEKVNVNTIKKYLDLGLIPILHGDILMDDKIKFSILSGDQIIYCLGKELKPCRIIIGTDVDGVFDSDPRSNKKAKLQKIIDKNNAKNIKINKTDVIDVTGQMHGKIDELLRLADYGIKSEIINIAKIKVLERSLTAQKVIKTVIR